MKALFVMLLYVSDFRGGPATIQGFQSLAACRTAIPVVEGFYHRILPTEKFRAECVELRAE